MTRDELLNDIETRLSKGRKVLLVGPPGVGKSWLLQQLAEHMAGGIYLPRPTPAKEGLLEVARSLHAKGKLADYEHFPDWLDVKKKLSGLTIPRLSSLLQESLERDHALVLLIDHLESCTPGLVPYLDNFIGLGPCVAATNDLNDDQVQAFAAKFQRLEVPPLTNEESQALLWQTLDRDKVTYPDMVQTKILKTASGNPGAIVDLAQNLSGERPTLAEIRSIHHEQGTPRVDVTIVLIMLLGMVTVLRYIGRGMDDLSLTIIGGLGMSLLWVFRPILWGLARRKN